MSPTLHSLIHTKYLPLSYSASLFLCAIMLVVTSRALKISKTFFFAQILIPIPKSNSTIQMGMSYFRTGKVLLMDWANTNWKLY